MKKNINTQYLDLLIQWFLLGLTLTYIGVFYFLYDSIPDFDRVPLTIDGRIVRRLSGAPYILLMYQIIHLLYWSLYKQSPQHQKIIGVVVGSFALISLIADLLPDFFGHSELFQIAARPLVAAAYAFFHYRYIQHSLSIPPIDDVLLDDDFKSFPS